MSYNDCQNISGFNLKSGGINKTMTEDSLYVDGKKYQNNVASKMLEGIFCPTDLSELFFSKENIKRIQHMLKTEMYKRTNGKYKIDDQDESDLLIAMRGTIMSYGDFLPNKIVHQVKVLNNKVVSDTLPDMITNVKQYYGYIDDINKPLQPIARPMNVSHAGRKTLPSLTSPWGF